jgi:hypothetical protein
MQPARCDADGNVYFVIVPEGDPRTDAGKASRPRDILRVEADGKDVRVLRPAAAEAFAGADHVDTTATTADSDGRLCALVWVTTGRSTTQHIVCFDGDGRVKSSQELDPEEMFVASIEAFGSGEFLLQGFSRQPEESPRMAVLWKGMDSLRDVIVTQGEASGEPFETVKSATHLARGGDGFVYYVPEAADSVGVIDPSGHSTVAFKLASTPQHWRLADLKASADRVAVFYYEARPAGNKSGRFWVAVYHSTLGELLGWYGPVSSVPVCYLYDGQDRFTFLRDARYLVTMTR